MKTWLENGGAEAVKAAKKEAKKASKGSSGASKKSKEGKYQHFNNIAYDSIASTWTTHVSIPTSNRQLASRKKAVKSSTLFSVAKVTNAMDISEQNLALLLR